MAPQATPTYTLVGKATMNKLRLLLTGFSWKHGFFASQSKGLYDLKALLKDQATTKMKIHSPLVEKRPHKSQQNFPTCVVVQGSTSLTMGTDLASSTPLNATPVTIFTKATGKHHLQHDWRPLPAKNASTEPHSALKHDDSQIHWASPIHGLPPENQQLEGQRPALRLQDDQHKAEKESTPKPTGANIFCSVKVNSNFNNDNGHTHHAQPAWGSPLQQQLTDGTPDSKHNASESKLVSMCLQSHRTKDLGFASNPYKPHESKTKTILIVMEQIQIVAKPTPFSQPAAATSMAMDQKQILIEPMPSQQLPVATRSIATDQQPSLVEPPPPPSPPDANDRPEAVMHAIDTWLDYQDYLEGKQMSPQPHRSGTDDWHHPLPIDGKRLLEQQSLAIYR